MMAFIAVLTLASFLLVVQDVDGQSFSYKSGSGTGPSEWGNLDLGEGVVNECGTGNSQSPVNIPSTEQCVDRTPIQFNSGDCNAEELEYEISPYNVEVSFQDCTIPPSAVLASGATYTLSQFHLHLRSEHKIDDQFYPSELHYVHTNEDGGIAVIGTFLEIYNDINNPLFQPLLDGLTKTAQETKVTCYRRGQKGLGKVFRKKGGWRDGGWLENDGLTNDDDDDQIIDPYALLAGTSHYYYSGSLTTPPCSEPVIWHVMDKPISISVLQYAELIDLEHDYIDPETCNFATLQSDAGDTNRPVQPLNGRSIEYYCA